MCETKIERFPFCYLTHFTSRASCAQSLELGGGEPLVIHKSGWFLKQKCLEGLLWVPTFDLFGLVIPFFFKYIHQKKESSSGLRPCKTFWQWTSYLSEVLVSFNLMDHGKTYEKTTLLLIHFQFDLDVLYNIQLPKAVIFNCSLKNAQLLRTTPNLYLLLSSVVPHYLVAIQGKLSSSHPSSLQPVVSLIPGPFGKMV